MVDFTAFQYRIATNPLPVKGAEAEMREGILLRSSADPNLWSEASPLPGFSQDTIGDVIKALASHDQKVPALEFAIDSLSHDFPLVGEIPVCALLAENEKNAFA